MSTPHPTLGMNSRAFTQSRYGRLSYLVGTLEVISERVEHLIETYEDDGTVLPEDVEKFRHTLALHSGGAARLLRFLTEITEDEIEEEE